MCGLLFRIKKSKFSKQDVREITASLMRVNHRGPDGEGIIFLDSQTGKSWILKTDETPNEISADGSVESFPEGVFDVCMGHRRLSIIDLSTNGHQPMNDDSGNWIIFNGEIYNYVEVRNELKNLGHKFRTETDTEVIHKAYLQWGTKCLPKFNGMWAFILWDNNRKSFFISNDRFGVKPLYYISDNQELIVTSEIKQFFDFKGKIGNLNRENLQIFLDQGHLDFDQTTMYSNVQRYPPGHYSFISQNGRNNYLNGKDLLPFYSLPTSVNNKISEDDAINQFRELLYSSVKLRLRADVPIGFALSGGLDSSAVLYTSRNIFKDQKQDFKVKTFSSIFPGLEGDESKFINIVSEDLKCDATFVNPLTDFNVDDFEKHIYHEETPLQTTAFFAQWSVDALVKKNGFKILLVGQGADEVFAGYHHHFYRYCRQLIMSGKIKKYLGLLRQYAQIKGKNADQLHRIIVNEVKLALRMKMGLSAMDSSLQKKWNSASTLIDLMKLDFSEYMLPTYLRSDDHDAMAHSIETRHPFMDYRIVDFGFSLPDNFRIREGWQKWIIRQSMYELPEPIRFRKDKKGFSTPQEIWMDKYKTQFESYLPYLEKEGFQYKDSSIFRTYSLGAFLKIDGENRNGIG